MKDNAAGGYCLNHFAGKFDSQHSGHRDIRKKNVGAEDKSRGEGGNGVAGRTDVTTIGGQQRSREEDGVRVIVHDQDSHRNGRVGAHCKAPTTAELCLRLACLYFHSSCTDYAPFFVTAFTLLNIRAAKAHVDANNCTSPVALHQQCDTSNAGDDEAKALRVRPLGNLEFQQGQLAAEVNQFLADDSQQRGANSRVVPHEFLQLGF